MRISDWSSDVCSSDLPAGLDKEEWTTPHSDPALWTLQLADAFGTRSSAVISLFMSQLESLCGRGIWDEAAHQWRMQESEMSAILALVNAFRPKNEPEPKIGRAPCRERGGQSV